MKKLGFLIALIGAATIVSCSSTSKISQSEADEATAQHVAYVLDNRLYKMDFLRAYPSSGRSFALNYSYYVSVIGDKVESFLPYFGRAYSIPYGGGEGLRFNAQIVDYKVEKGKKNKEIVTFSARTMEDNYNFRIEIYPTGETYLNINAMQKQAMSFSGNIDLNAEFERVMVK